MWQKTKTGSKQGFDKLWSLADKLGAPVNRLSNKLGSEAFWPTTLDKESDKAARILRSFCKDGFYEQETVEADGVPKGKQRVLKKIPAQVIKEAKGLAIFTTMRTGLWISGAGGSGVLVARLPDGTWSPPSGILLHTAGVGFLVGVDIYDCVIIINSESALAAFSKVRCTVGSEISAVAGPLGVGGVVESEVHKRRAPIFTYLKSRGFYAGVQLDGTIVIERSDENERFYHRRIPVAEILAGKVGRPPHEAQKLIQTLKAAQGDTDVDPMMLTLEPPPSDFDIADGQTFGVPNRDDPDPYGVLALEKEGLEIREAGTKQPAPRHSFQFSPSPTSPLFHAFNRDSIDGALSQSRRSSWRTTMTDRSVQTVDMATQTDVDLSNPSTRPQSASYRSSMANIPELQVNSIDDQLNKAAHPELKTKETTVGSDYGQITNAKEEETEPSTTSVGATEHQLKELTGGKPEPAEAPQTQENDSDADDEDDEEPIIHEFQQATSPQFITASPQVITKARLVTVVKPPPPALPPRNPIRKLQTGPPSPNPDLVEGTAETSQTLTSNLVVAPSKRRPSSSSSVYSLRGHDQPSSVQTSESTGSISSVEHPDIIPHSTAVGLSDKILGNGIAAVPLDAVEVPTKAKPPPPALPPRSLSEFHEPEAQPMPGSFN